MNDSMKPHESQSQIDQIVEKALLSLREKDYKKAAEIIKNGLQAHPNQKELLNLYSEIQNKYKNEKIQKLQEEALMFMSSGAEDKAQDRLRQILQLDPTRTDLKESLRKTRAEVVAEYNYRAERMQLIRISSMVLLTIIVILCSIALGAWWSNYKHLKKSKEFIASGYLYDGRQELKKCGWFLAGKKQEVNKELQSAINALINRAAHCAELKNFQEAKQYLETAAQAAENSSQIEEQIKKYDQLEQQWKEELAKQKEEQEKQIALSEKALTAKQEFQKVLAQSLENKVDIESKDAIEAAKNKAQTAENLFSQNQFESAEKQWLSAAEDCRKASKVTEKIRTDLTTALAFKQKCSEAAESAREINASVEAYEIWKEAEKIRNSAEQNFAQNNFDAAGQLWEQAANKYNEALQAAMQSPAYKKTLLMQKKWLYLKQGLSEEDIRNILGSPKCIQAASDHCIWYYQTTPTASKNDEGKYECIPPQYGYVRFGTLSIQIIIDRNNEAYQKYMDEEKKMHEKAIADLNRQIQEENRIHSNFRFIPSYPQGQKKSGTYSSGIYSNDEERKRDDTLRTEKLRHENKIRMLNNSITNENQGNQDRMEKLTKDNQTKINNLTNGLSPREPRYIVSDWILPDQNDLASLLVSEEIKEKKIKPSHKWQMPIKWKSLRLNIKEDEVYSILGPPNNTSSEPGKKIYRYGQIAEYGFLTFEDSTDSFKRLRYWKEPLWTYVAQELQSEKQLSDPNQDASLDKPNEPNEPNKPDVNDANSLF